MGSKRFKTTQHSRVRLGRRFRSRDQSVALGPTPRKFANYAVGSDSSQPKNRQ